MCREINVIQFHARDNNNAPSRVLLAFLFQFQAGHRSPGHVRYPLVPGGRSPVTSGNSVYEQGSSFSKNLLSKVGTSL